MSGSLIRFTCGHCGISLSVSAEMAGAEGPCPSCHAIIRAPFISPPVAPVAEAIPAYQPEKISSVFPSTLPDPASTSATEAGHKIRPEPRALPGGGRISTAEPISAKHSTEDAELQRDPVIKRIKIDRHRRRFDLARILIPIIFLILAAVLVTFLLRHVMKPDADLPPLKSQEHAASDTPSMEAPPVRVSQEPQSTPVKSLSDPTAVTQTAENKVVEQILAGDATARSLTPESFANKQLLTFLDTNSVEERANLTDPAKIGAEFAGTLFAKPLIYTTIDAETSETNQEKNYIDYPFLVGMKLDDRKKSDVTVVVRVQGLYDPKILIEPLLDTIGGRIKDYCSKPSDLPGQFKCVIETISNCYDDSVPNKKDKFTIRLKTGPSGMVIKEVYADNSSEIGKMLTEPESKLRWGTRARATVTLAWNKTEDPNKPYLQLVKVDSLSW